MFEFEFFEIIGGAEAPLTPPAPRSLYVWEDLFSEGFLLLRFGGHIFRRAYFRK